MKKDALKYLASILLILILSSGLLNAQQKNQEVYSQYTFKVTSTLANTNQIIDQEFTSDFNYYKYYSVSNDLYTVILGKDLGERFLKRRLVMKKIEIEVTSSKEVTKSEAYNLILPFYKKHHQNQELREIILTQSEYDALPEERKKALESQGRKVTIK